MFTWPYDPIRSDDRLPSFPRLFHDVRSALLHNGDTEFRAVWLRTSLNYTGITGGESVESDICLSIFPQVRPSPSLCSLACPAAVTVAGPEIRI